MVDILAITTIDLKKGKYRSALPDLYAVKGLREKNVAHNDQDVFNHTLSVFNSLLVLLSTPPLSAQKSNLLNKRLAQKPETLTRKEILILVSLYHDTGKGYTLIKNKDGTTSCPGHEQVGAHMALGLANSLKLSQEEISLLSHLISLHGFVNEVAIIYANKHDKAILKIFSERAKGWDAELVLFMLADLDGSDLKKLNQKLYLEYRKTLVTMLDFFL